MLFNYLKSTILSKVVMALTGVILVLFIIGHTVGNLQIFIGKETYNNYAAFLQGLGEILWIVRITLLLCLIFHIITSVRLKLLNRSAKPQKYEIKNYVKAKLTSRTMLWTGIMIFLFLTYHILHFTIGVISPEDYKHHEYFEKNTSIVAKDATGDITIDNEHYVAVPNGKLVFTRHDAYLMVIKGFQRPIHSIIYIIGVLLLCFHLNHAIQSAFQTLGFNHPTYFPKIVAGSTILSALIAIGMIAVPLNILFGVIGGGL